MFGNWLRTGMEDRARRSGAREVQRFIEGLRKMPDRDLGVIVGIAAVVRVNMEAHGVLPEGLFAREVLSPSDDLGLYQMRINRIARQFAKDGQAADATGAMVWSYSLRCLNVGGLAPLGRELWAELRRGFPHAAEALDEGEERRGAKFDARVWAEWDRIPPGFGPPAPEDGDGPA